MNATTMQSTRTEATSIQLDATTDLFDMAARVLGGVSPKRYHLFRIPSFVAAFRSMPYLAQCHQWAALSTSRNGAQNKFVNEATLAEWFIDFSHHPHTYNLVEQCWNVGQCLPELQLRTYFAEQVEQMITSGVHPSAKKASTFVTDKGRRNRIIYAGVVSPKWLKLARKTILGGLRDEEYNEWLGAPEAQAKFPLLMVHEKAWQRGELRMSRAVADTLAHPISLAQKPQRKWRVSKNPGRDAQIAQAKRDRRQTALANIEADIASINLGTDIKGLRKAMAARMGHMPRLGTVVAYLKSVIEPLRRADFAPIRPQYTEIGMALSAQVDEVRAANPSDVSAAREAFKGLWPELAMFGIGMNSLRYQTRVTQVAKEILPRT